MLRFIPIRFAFVALVPAGVSPAIGQIGYNRDIRPILSDKCFQCHGPDSAKREADLRLDVPEEAIKAEAIIPGDLKKSGLIRHIHETDPDEVMPPPDFPRQLTSAEKDTLARWIESGAEYEPHWAFTPLPASVAVPQAGEGWASGDLDRFIAARLKLEKLNPAPAAEPERWFRRASFDLTGLPPSSADLNAFLADERPGARERAVDRLLASPAYGERMAVDWLDVARYADSFGYQSDLDTHAWPYRDWVISAFNQNLPWDQFITWQLAGDLLPNPTRGQILATAFNRVHRKTQEGGSVEAEFRLEGVSDRVHTFGTAFLALTMECSRCHDHKYDPLPMRDYYSLGAFFNSIDEWGLLHGSGSIQPNPTLLLTNPDQDQQIAERKQQVIDAGKALAAKIAERESSFQAWLAAPTAEAADLSGSYDFEQRDKDTFANGANPDLPAKTNANNKPVPGFKGEALSFTGDDALTLGNHGVSHQEDGFSVAFRVKPGEISKRAVVFHNSQGYDPGYNGFELLLEDGRLRWMAAREWPGCCIAVRSKDVIPVNGWTHVCVTYDGSSRAAGLKIYLNGSEARVEIVRDQLTRNCGSASAFTFGARVRDNGFRNGAVDGILIYQRPVTPIEVTALHADKPLAEIIASTPRDEAGLGRLRAYFASAVDQETRSASQNLKSAHRALRQAIDPVREIP